MMTTFLQPKVTASILYMRRVSGFAASKCSNKQAAY